jgi:serine/threonine-protein kinase
MTGFRKGAVLKDRYVLGRQLGRGGMAAVWLGQDLVLDREVAVKVLSDALGSDRAFAARFRREATVVAGLSHPNLVRIYDYSESDERPYLVMEFVPGEDLGRLIARGTPIDRDELARELLGALAHIHGFGIVHRDIKPQNVIVAGDGTVKLIDFGIALPPDATALTQPGLVLATKSYAAPEVLAGEPADARSDLYSCGALLDSCAGPASPSLRRLISRLTNQQPGDRPRSAAAALEELEVTTAPAQPTEAFVPVFTETMPEEREEPPGPEREAAAIPTRLYPRGRSNRKRWLAAAAILVAAAALAIVATSGGGGSGNPQAGAGNTGQKAKGSTSAKNGHKARETTSAGQEQSGESTEAEAPPAEEEAPAEEGAPAEKEAPASENDSAQLGATPARIDPTTGAALNQQGFEMIQAGEYEAAVPVLEESVASFPTDSEELAYAYALFNLGDALRRSGRPDEAIPVLERRLLIPNQPEVVERELAAAEQEARAAGD